MSGCRSSHLAWLALTVLVAAAGCAGPEKPDDSAPDGGTSVTPADGGTSAPDGGTTTTPDGGTVADTCGFNHFEHALGFACNRDGDCTSGLCYHEVDPFGGPGRAYCTQECEQDSDCPTGFTCGETDSGGTACLAGDSTTLLPGDHTLKLGAPCSQSSDCEEGGVCAQSQNADGSTLTFCAPACDKSQADSCGACGTCEDFNTGGDAPESFCVPKGAKADGAKCDSSYDCGTFICAGFCTEVCGGTSGVTCPTGATCQQISDTTSICIDPAQKGGTAVGSACLFDFECATGAKCRPDASGSGSSCRTPAKEGETCATSDDCEASLRCLRDPVAGTRACAAPSDVGGNCSADGDCITGLKCNDVAAELKVCTKPCSAGCGAGNACGVVDLDTMVRVYNTDQATSTSAAIARNDDIDYDAGNLWSRISTLTLQPGTYWVSVETYKQFLGGYKLSVTVNGQTPVAAIELPETPVRNDTAPNAQEINGFPFEVSGTIDGSTDVDFYKFTVPGSTAVTVTIEAGPGEASECFPTAKLAQTPVGGACNFNAYCDSGLCEAALQVCGKSCTTDQDCGNGFACADLDGHQTCVTAASVGTKARNAKCTYSFECQDRFCLAFQGDHFCSPRCEDPAVNCGVGNECATLPQTIGGQATTIKACVTEGDKSGTFNSTCVRLSDCAPDLLCTDGVCAKQCATNSDCPAQNFPGTLPSGSNACKACTSYADCSADGDCVDGVGFEKFCVDACDSSGKCPSGFHCDDSFFGSYCMPDHGSCRSPVCQVPQGQTAGLCTVPQAAFGELCTASAQCTTNNCGGGLCTTTCAQDSDCGCATGDLICKQGTCQRTSAYGSEVEPNDTTATAQALTGGLPIQLFGSFTQNNGTRDVDYFTIALKAGDSVHVVTRPVCGTAAPSLDTAVTLLLNGAMVAEDDFFDSYGTLQYTATADGTYLIEVKDDSYGSVIKDGMYVLEITK